MDGAQGIRLVFIVLSALVIVFLVVKSVPVYRDLTWGQRLFLLGSISMLIYSADGAREAFMLDLGWRWRLLFFAVGIAAYAAYILEPLSAQKRYFKGRSWFDRDHHSGRSSG